MPRIARKDLNTPFLHIMVQGVNKEYIFNNNKYIEKYMNIVKTNNKIYNFTILAYCIMNNHAHFLIYTKDIKQLGTAMQKINLKYAQMYNKEENRCGVLFRNRYQAEPIYDMKYLINCIKYIHNNPVKAKMVSRCEEYKYSSYLDYINNTGVTQSEILCEVFGENCDYQKLFKETYDRKFMDVDSQDVEEYMKNGIMEFKNKNNKGIVEIFSERYVLVELVRFLKKECNFKYTEIGNFFGIPRGTMDCLK